jgi:hypothetical protein
MGVFLFYPRLSKCNLFICIHVVALVRTRIKMCNDNIILIAWEPNASKTFEFTQVSTSWNFLNALNSQEPILTQVKTNKLTIDLGISPSICDTQLFFMRTRTWKPAMYFCPIHDTRLKVFLTYNQSILKRKWHLLSLSLSLTTTKLNHQLLTCN